MDSQSFAAKIKTDRIFRLKITLSGSFAVNAAYSLLQLGMGIVHSSFWFYSMAAYYFLLAVMRFFLLRHTLKHKKQRNLLLEHKKYRTCGIILLVMNLAVSLMTFFMVYWGRTFVHHEITVIALATYTFTAFTAAVVNTARSRLFGSPVLSAARMISLAAASVSMLTLETTMLTAFGSETVDASARKIMLGTSGGAISAFIIALAVYMVVHGTKMIRQTESQKEKK